MVGLSYDCLANPLRAVRFTFDKAVASGYDPAVLQGKDWGEAELFRQFLFDDDCLSQVPMLSPSTLKWAQPNTLVRFRGMIQDMLGNEFYVGAYKVPGQNLWAESSREAVKNPRTNLISPQREKRPREDEAVMGDVDMMREDGISLEPLTMPQSVTEGTFSHLSLVPDAERHSFPRLIKIKKVCKMEF